MEVHCWLFCSSTAFMVCPPFCLADDNVLLLLPLVNSFHGSWAVFLKGWQRIAHSSAHQQLSWFARRFTQRMTAHCGYFHSSKAFTMVCVPYCTADGSGLLVLLLVNGFHGLLVGLLNGCQSIASTIPCKRLTRLFAPGIALRMASDYSFFHSCTAFTLWALFY